MSPVPGMDHADFSSLEVLRPFGLVRYFVGSFSMGVAFGRVGYSIGNYGFEGMSHPNYGVPVQPLTFESTVAGPALTAAVQPGWWLAPHLGLAVELGQRPARRLRRRARGEPNQPGRALSHPS